MPTYDYRCKSCGHELEVHQGFDEDALTQCPACGADTLRKRFAPVGIAFKGSGFYKTDSRSSSTSGSSSKTPADSGAAAASTSSGTDKAGTDKAGTDKKDKGSGGDKPTSAASGSASGAGKPGAAT